jgi:PAS domain S-box-containing protein
MEPQRALEPSSAGERLFQSVFRAAAIGIAVENLEGQPLSANPALCAMLGFTEEEMCGKHCVEFSPPEDAKKDWAFFEQLREGLISSYQLEKRFYRKDGTLTWGRLTVSLIKDLADSSPLVVAMVENISDRKAAEEELQRSEANLRHLASRLLQAQEEERKRIGRDLHDDVGQRLSLLAVGLEDFSHSLAEYGQMSASQQASTLHDEVDQVATDILNLSRYLHSSRLEVLGLHFALRSTCQQISKQRQVSISFRGDELNANLSPDLQLCIFRVAQEALNNVVRHSRSQQAVLDLTREDDMIVLKVTDFGVGFDPSSTSQGIGLSSMRERLRMFGGELSLESIPGNGTTVIAKVNLEKAKAATQGES